MIERQPIPLDLSPTAEPGGVAVLGLGGWGSRAVGRLAAQGPASPLYVAVDSDAAALRRCPAPLKIQAGPKIAGGLGCGRPELGRLAFEDTWPELARLLAPAKIVFIVAGLGGGFGGGAAPAAAEALAGRPGPPTTIAAATLPPGRERRRRLAAERALAELIRRSDSVLTAPGQASGQASGQAWRLDLTWRPESKAPDRSIAGSSVASSLAFGAAAGGGRRRGGWADETLHEAVGELLDVLDRPGEMMNLDGNDLRTLLRRRGLAAVGAGQAEGPGRAAEALRRALSAPLMAEAAVGEAAAALVRISAGPDLLLDEFAAVNETVADLLAPEADLFSSVTVDEELGRRGALKVVVMAAGLGGWRRSAGPDVAARRPVEAVVEPAVEAAVEPDRNLGTRSGQAPGQKPVQELVREPVREPLRDEERDAAGESIRDSFQAPLSETAAETAVKAPPSLALEATSDLAPASAAVFGAAFELALEASRRRRRRRRATGLVVGGRRRGDGGCGPRPELTLVRPGAGDRLAD